MNNPRNQKIIELLDRRQSDLTIFMDEVHAVYPQSVLREYPTLDLRAATDFCLAHLQGSTSIPVAEIESRLHELPIRGATLNLIGGSDQLQNGASILLDKGYKIGKEIDIDNLSVEQLKQKHHFVAGDRSIDLWQPASVVKYFAENYSNLTNSKNGIDLACGSGRDSIFMSKQGWRMTSVDYSQSSLERLAAFAKNHRQQIRLKKLDLEKNLSELLAENKQYSAVIIIRYLHRPMLCQLQKLIERGGYIVYQTFLKGCEKYGSPKNPRYLLNKGELAEVFSDFDILHDEIELLADGRPTNSFIARRVH